MRKRELVTVEAVRLNVRSKPTILADAVRTVTLGTELEKLGEVRGLGLGDQIVDWIKVPDGYVMKEFVS